MKTVKKGTTTLQRKFFSGLCELCSIFCFLLLLLCFMGHMMQLKFKQLKACLSLWHELTERQTMQTLHKFPKLNQQQHAEQFELKPNSNQTHQLTMPTTHTHRPPRMMESVLCRWDCNRISHKYWHMCGGQRGGRGTQTKPKAVAIRWFIGQFAPPPPPLRSTFFPHSPCLPFFLPRTKQKRNRKRNRTAAATASIDRPRARGKGAK